MQNIHIIQNKKYIVYKIYRVSFRSLVLFLSLSLSLSSWDPSRAGVIYMEWNVEIMIEWSHCVAQAGILTTR